MGQKVSSVERESLAGEAGKREASSYKRVALGAGASPCLCVVPP